MNKELSHELWAAAQLTPGEGIEDGADRIAAILSRIGAERGKEAACWQFQDTDGSWHYFVDERHKENTIAAGYPVRPLFLTPQPAMPEGMALVLITKLEEMKQHKAQAIGLLEFLREHHPEEFARLAAAGVAP